MRRRKPQPKASYATPYRLRKVLVKQEKGCASMTMAKFVPWGLPLNPPGFRCATIAEYLGVSVQAVTTLAKRFWMELYYDAPLLRTRKTCTHSKWKMVSEEDAARIIAHVRASQGKKALRARERAEIPLAPTAVSTPTPKA